MSDRIPATSDHTGKQALLFAAFLAFVAMMLLGCGERAREESVAAANIWHAAEAIRLGVPPEKPVKAIQASAKAIAGSNGYTIVGAKDE